MAIGARAGFGRLVGKICGPVALALAIVAIFVPITGILISCIASALAVANGVAERCANDAFHAADVACHHSPHPPGADSNKLCYDAGKQALDATPQPSYAMLTAVSLLLPLLAWLSYWLG